MKIRHAVCLAAALLAGCAPSLDKGYQGWVEAEQVFVSPHEPGRVETLLVREGDAVVPLLDTTVIHVAEIVDRLLA